MANLNFTVTQINADLLRASIGTQVDAWREGGIAPDTGIDCTAALNAFMTNYATFGARIFLAPGVYSIAGQLLVPNKVSLIGAGKRATTIRALAGFTGASYMIQLGPDSAPNYGFDCYLEHLFVDANNVAAIGCVDMKRCQEGSGLRSVGLTKFATIGCNLDSAFGNANCYFNEIESYGNSGHTASLYFKQCGGKIQVSNVTVLANGSDSTTTTGTSGIYIQDGNFHLLSIHVEGVVSGVAVGGNNTTGYGLGINAGAGSKVTNVVDYQGGTTQWRALDIVKGANATNSVRNALHGTQLITEGHVVDTAGLLSQSVTAPTITPSGSPFIFQNVSSYNIIVIVFGSVTKIEWVRDTAGSPTWLDTGLTQGVFPLANRDRLRVTYPSTAPSMIAFPMC